MVTKADDFGQTMYMRGSLRRGLTTTMFYTTMAIAVLTVAAPQVLPCPVQPRGVGAESPDKEREQWKKKVVVKKE